MQKVGLTLTFARNLQLCSWLFCPVVQCLTVVSCLTMFRNPVCDSLDAVVVMAVAGYFVRVLAATFPLHHARAERLSMFGIPLHHMAQPSVSSNMSS